LGNRNGSHQAETDSVQTLSTKLKSLPPWRHSRSFTDSEWRNIIETAKLVQTSTPDDVRAALRGSASMVKLEDYTGDYEEDSRVFILMRVAFDLPERAPTTDMFSFKGFSRTNSDFTGESRVNLDWPITWSKGTPELVAQYEGSQGPPYIAVDEYNYLLARFPYRDLTAVAKTLR
jgi:predicted heme/steroid binding protein